VSELGIDDFSFRRGEKIGTILVDMPKPQTIDLLPDSHERKRCCLMSAHPEIDLVSRDRGGIMQQERVKVLQQATPNSR